jgi:hypothetical protein
MKNALQEFQQTDDGLLTASKEGDVPSRRIADAKSAHASLRKMMDDDSESSRGRAQFQAMFDGQRPYRDEDLIETGQGGRSNLNFDEAGALLEFSMSGYVDLFSNTDEFMRFRLRQNSFPAPERMRYESIISKNFTGLLRKWSSFFHKFLYCCHHFVADGLSVCYYPDHLDWRWHVAKLGDFFFPRHTLADPGALELAGSVQKYRPSQIYAYIKNPTQAAELGWDVKAVREALIKSANATGDRRVADWEQVQERLKNNDLYFDCVGSEIAVGHLWVKEFSGMWSHYQFLNDGSPTEFIYKKEDKYPSNRPPFHVFMFGIGSNGYVHSIRGLGYKIYPHIQVSNRLRNQVVDSAMLSSSVMIQPADEQALADLSLTYYGPYAILTPGNKVIERTIPNLANNAMPVINDMSGLLQSKTGQYSSVGMFADDKERTRFEVEAYVARMSKLSITSLNLFYEPFQNLLREVARRVFNPAYGPDLPGGDLVVELRDRLLEEGIPEEAFGVIDFDRCSVNRAVGGGSPEARQLILNELAKEAPSFDDIGRHNLLRDRVAARVGYDLADRYVPENTEPRPTIDDKLAVLENAHLINGEDIQAQSNELHLIHLKHHDARLRQFFDALESGESSLADSVQPMVMIHAHATQHVEMGGVDPAISDMVAVYRQQLQQYGEMIWNGQEKLKAEARKAQEAAASPAETGQPTAPPQDQSLPPEMERKLIEHNLRLEMKQEEHQQKLNMRQAEFAQKQAINDAKEAAKMRRLGV